MKTSKVIFVLWFFLALIFAPEVFAFTETKTGQVQLNMNKLLSSDLVKEGNHWCTISGWSRLCYSNNLYNDCTLFCNNNNNYTYSFNYETKKNHVETWTPLEKENIFKCDTVRSKFSVIGDWGANLEKKCAEVYKNIMISNSCWSHSPPTDIVECTDKDDCLYKAKGYTLTPEYSGKGVHQVPANFVSGVEKSLLSNNSATVCADGSCPITKEGLYKLSMKAPETNYYGQCKGYGMTLEPDGTKIPETNSVLDLNIINRTPITTITLSNKNFKVGEEVDVHCDAFDPDDCVDKISKVTMRCQDNAGNSDKCLIYDPAVGTLGSSLTKEIGGASQTNPYRLSAKFKVTQAGSYMVVCNATDNNGASSTYPDGSNDGNGVGVNGATVTNPDGSGTTPLCTPNDNRCDPNCTPVDVDCAKCIQDNVCITGCAVPDPDCPNGGVIDSSMRFCALVPNKGAGAPVCGDNSEIKYSAEALYNINPITYKWKCGEKADESWVETKDPKYTCKYAGPGTFMASLRVTDKSGKETDCKLQEKVKITTEKSCRVEVRKAGTTEDFSDKVIIRAGESIDARVKQECLGKLPVTWSAAGGSVGTTKDGVTEIKFTSAGEKSVGAKMTKTIKEMKTITEKDEEGNDVEKKVEVVRQEVTDCAGVLVDVKDVSNWGS